MSLEPRLTRRARRAARSISLPITLASVSVALAIALLVGWTLLYVQNQRLPNAVASQPWLLVLGIVAFAVIMTVLVTVSVFLVRETREVRRHNQFIDSVTHELRSPLASLRLCTETLQHRELAPAQKDELHEMMLADVERLSIFIDDVLEANRLGQRRSHMMNDVELEEVARRVVASVERRFHLEAGTIRVDLPSGLRLSTDATSLEIVLRNLLDNAVKYSSAAPEVHLSAALGYDSASVRIEVIDRGIGLAKQHLRRVFQRFYRVESEAVRMRAGTGLGLYVVAELVRNLDGGIEAHSDGEGKGTKMVITLPRGRTPANTDEKMTTTKAEA